MATIQELKNISSQVRRDIVRMVHGCQSGHLSYRQSTELVCGGGNWMGKASVLKCSIQFAFLFA